MDTAVAGVAPAYSCIRCLQRYCTLAHQSINRTLSRSMSVKWNSTSPVHWMMSSLFFWLRNLLRLLRFMMRPIINCCVVPWNEIASLVASKDIVLLTDQSISLSVLLFYFTSYMMRSPSTWMMMRSPSFAWEIPPEAIEVHDETFDSFPVSSTVLGH